MGSVGGCTDLFGDESLGDKGCTWNFVLLMVANTNEDKRHERTNSWVHKAELDSKAVTVRS